jgi:hypothetical protein
VIHVSDTSSDRIEGFERVHETARRKNFDLDPPTGGSFDRLRETNRHGMNTRRHVGPVGHHL